MLNGEGPAHPSPPCDDSTGAAERLQEQLKQEEEQLFQTQ
jgi:hypothetical protein